ncbi:hypothetical protein BH20ACT5_BH20ACT5_07600 [soil metagenome]
MGRSQELFRGTVLGPHFEGLCRWWAGTAAAESTFGAAAARVGEGVVNDPANRVALQVDVVVAGTEGGVLSLGEVKYGEVMGVGHLGRLRGIRQLLAQRDVLDPTTVTLACYSGSGFTAGPSAAEDRGEVVLVDLSRIYTGR